MRQKDKWAVGYVTELTPHLKVSISGFGYKFDEVLPYGMRFRAASKIQNKYRQQTSQKYNVETQEVSKINRSRYLFLTK